MSRSTPPYLLPKILEIEAEIDRIWAGRRIETDPATGNDTIRVPRFDRCETKLLYRLKYLLKRWSLLSSGRDWEVRVVPDAKNPRKCYAHSILPQDVAPDLTGIPPRVDMPPVRGARTSTRPEDVLMPDPAIILQPESPAALALRLRVPLAAAEAATLAHPDDLVAREASALVRGRPRVKRAPVPESATAYRVADAGGAE
jgi:hypothetical protein